MTRTWAARMLTVAAVATLGVGLGACGGDDSGTVTEGQSSDTTAGGTGATYGSENSGGGGGGTSSDGVVATDFQYDVDTLNVGAGDTFSFANEGDNAHTFTVEGTDIDIETSPGDDVDVTAPSDPGTYEAHCRFHPTMTLQLVVE